jgi:TadE-like protein
MRSLDRRGSAAFEFCIVAVAFFTLVFTIFDLGRYLITVQSLRTLAGAGARAIMMDDCYVDNVIKKQAPSGCPSDPLSAADKQEIAPFLFAGGLTPTLSAPVGEASPITVTAAQPGFTMMMPIWGSSFDAPSASTQIPY